MKYVRNKKRHEDNLKAMIDRMCHEQGIHLDLEYSHENCRFDAVVVRGGEILAIIEVKPWGKVRALKEKENPSEQLQKYLNCGLPVLVVWKFTGVKKAIQRLKEIVGTFDSEKRIWSSRLLFFPEPNPPSEAHTREMELQKLIKQQKNDKKWGHIQFNESKRYRG